MFRELLPLVRQRLVMISICHDDDDKLQVSVIPKVLKEGENSALTTPLSVTGTAEELDAELPKALVEFVAGHLSLQNALAQARAEMENAAKKAKEEARSKSKAPSSARGNESPKPSTTSAPAAGAPPPGLFDTSSGSSAGETPEASGDAEEEEPEAAA